MARPDRLLFAFPHPGGALKAEPTRRGRPLADELSLHVSGPLDRVGATLLGAVNQRPGRDPWAGGRLGGWTQTTAGHNAPRDGLVTVPSASAAAPLDNAR